MSEPMRTPSPEQRELSAARRARLDMRAVQELLACDSNVTRIYAHGLRLGAKRVRSPLDA